MVKPKKLLRNLHFFYSLITASAVALSPPASGETHPTKNEITASQTLGAFSSRYPKEGECVRKDKEGSNGRLIEWKEINSLRELDEQLFDTFSEHSDLDSIKGFLKANGFNVSYPMEMSKVRMKAAYGIDAQGTQITASKEREAMQISLGWWHLLGVNGLSIAITADQCGNVLKVKSVLNRT